MPKTSTIDVALHSKIPFNKKMTMHQIEEELALKYSSIHQVKYFIRKSSQFSLTEDGMWIRHPIEDKKEDA